MPAYPTNTGKPGGQSSGAAGDKKGLFRKLTRQFRLDRTFTAKWRDQAKEDFDFVAGEQYSEEDKAHLKETMRPVIVMNRTQTVINAVSGQEMGNRQEVRYLPREPGDIKPNELLTEGGRWFRDAADGDDVDSDAFLRMLTCGMGWTDTTLNYDESREGEPEMAAPNPIEMYWDKSARDNNITDAERIWRVKRMPRSAVARMFPDAALSDLDAGWARSEGDEGEIKNIDRERRYEESPGDSSADDDDEDVTIVHCQYIVRQKAWDVISPLTGEQSEMSDADYQTYIKRAQQLGMPVKGAPKDKRVIKDCWLGGAILETGDAICQDKFRYQCITGLRDETKGTFYGLVRSMKDPQRWANKWLSQTLDLMNSQAKGGVMMEDSAVDDMRKFEKTWSRADKPTILANGALSNPNGPRVQPKPVGQFPQGFYQLMEFSFSMIQQVPGINPELMGQADRDQPASLEFQRKQAGMTILQPYFKNLKRYRKEQGYVILYILQNHMSDGRLIRIMGQDQEQYVPLIRQADVKYDIIVDDSPTSPNQKEMIWAMISEKFWEMPQETQLAFIDYSPFPSTVVEKLKQAADEQAQNPMTQLQQQLAQAEAALKEAQAALAQANTGKSQAETQQIMSEIGQPSGKDPMLEHGREMAKLGVQQAKNQGEMQLNREKAASEMQLAREKHAADISLQQQKDRADMVMQARKTQADMATQHMQAATSAAVGAYSAQQKAATAAKAAARKPAPARR